MAEGAEPLKPKVAILLTALLISNSVVAGFRGEKNEQQLLFRVRRAKIN